MIRPWRVRQLVGMALMLVGVVGETFILSFHLKVIGLVQIPTIIFLIAGIVILLQATIQATKPKSSEAVTEPSLGVKSGAVWLSVLLGILAPLMIGFLLLAR